MTMHMGEAFDSDMLTRMEKVRVHPGSYDEENNWVQGRETKELFFGVIVAGNRFSQFQEGIGLHNMDGGARTSHFKKLYVKDNIDMLIKDKVIFKKVWYNVLQKADETHFGFSSYILEKSDKKNGNIDL